MQLSRNRRVFQKIEIQRRIQKHGLLFASNHYNLLVKEVCRMNFLINSYLWAPLIFLQYFLIAYLSFKASKEQTFKSLFLIWCVGIIPTWTTICKFSNDLALAGFIFDFLVVSGWGIGTIFFQGKTLGSFQYIGMILMIIGIILFKKQG